MSNDPMAEIRASFFVECEELLESLQDSLNLMDEGAHDAETINVVFRAVHSIKGGAGAFGLDALVAFAHRYETVLDELRADRITLTAEAMKLFFQAADMLQDQVRAASEGDDEPPGAEEVLTALEALLGEDGLPVEEEVDFTPAGLTLDFGAPSAGEDATPMAMQDDTIGADATDEACWAVSFTPAAGLYQSGNETLLLLRSLAELGRCETRCIVPDPLPAPCEDTAETPLLSWHVILRGDVTEADIGQVFDFVSDVCTLEITQATPSRDALGSSFLMMNANSSDPASPAKPEPAPGPTLSLVAEKPVPDEARASAPAADTRRPAEMPSGPPAKPAAKAAKANAAAEPGATVRVDLEKIDRLVNLVGELVINQAMLAQSVEEAGVGHHTDVMSGLESFMTLTRDIQESVMMIRAQPVKPLFQRMGRIVREASSSVGKEVRLKTEGDYTEVDKTVIERLSDPLTHMIRNAVDHGLETPEKRRAAGKPSEGVILLSASHRAGRVLIEIEDDGAGIDRDKVRDIAIGKGLIPADAQLTDTEIDNLLFLPGFSTASQISALSGRGVGMDVVKSAITALGGRISITSTPGQGTKFSISLPLTLAVLDGMVVQAAGQTLVVPLSAIVETAKLENSNIQRLASSGEMMQIRGEFVPLFDLGRQLGFRNGRDGAKSGIILLTSQDDGKRAALIVDAIMEQRQVVIKGLGQSYGNIPGVAAATILGDGQIALILDPADLTHPGNRLPVNELKAAG
ncbi:chemotaxis protein CheA [Paracoccus sediminicola]|uniref:chemotaxis protein CheA n=1 Tax=Paracoccus sediminicola TaxID=3017783 RepID=UPI0022F11BCF|nr:chemotaxis protein CheA [Paracoccus sediminicola]WBU58168.1 chemotaxis protein CheA [Paracoccus sediminicola]